MKTLRWARIEIAGAHGDVRIRNLSATGAMIDGIDLPGDMPDTPVRIELGEGQLMPATMRWWSDGQAGIEFTETINLDRLNTTPARSIRRARG